MTNSPGLRLLWFNLTTDTDDPILGFTTAWINALAAYCEYIDVLTMRMGRLAVADNVHVYSVGKEQDYSEPRRAIEFYRILTGLLRKRSYNACFAHMMPLFAVMGAPLLKLMGIPITLWYTHKATPLILWLALIASDRVVTASKESFRLSSSKVIVTGHGINTDLFVPATIIDSSERPFTILSVGRISPVKRLETLIEATRLLVYEHHLTSLRVRLVGIVYSHDIQYAEYLHRLVVSYQLEDTIEFVPPVSFDLIVKEYWQADVMVNSSDTGSLDKSVLEAMSCGLPVVSSNEAFIPLLAPWKELLLIPQNAPEAMASRLQCLASQSLDQRKALGRELRRLVEEHHSLSGLVASLCEILTDNKR